MCLGQEDARQSVCYRASTMQVGARKAVPFRLRVRACKARVLSVLA